MKRYETAALKEGLYDLLLSLNVKPEHANALLDCMIEADMRGVCSHGLSVFPAYINKLKNGGFTLDAQIEIQKSSPAFTLFDAHDLIGAASAKECMNIAIEKCLEYGMHTVFCKNANTFGPAFYYAKMATDKKLIGICLCNSPTAMPAWGGNKKLLGTNPFSIGFPAEKHAPLIVDMATSVVAKSKINEIRKKGGVIPEGWAVDEDGNPTTDPASAIRGMVLPMAAHKGSAIAMSIDILAGVLSGAGYQNKVNRFYSEDNKCMNVGHCFIAINPDAVSDKPFCDEIDEYIEAIHASGENVLYPGEREGRSLEASLLHGVELSDETIEALSGLFDKNKFSKVVIEHVG